MARTQFSLRTLLAAVAVVRIGAALWVADRAFTPVVGLLCVLTHWLLVRPED
jgi:hypothetical protein